MTANLDRITLLKQFAEEEPGNPFNWYALALEYRVADPGQAESLFLELLNHHKSYLPTYYAAAHFFSDYGQLEKARQTFEDGMTLARQLQESKALHELTNAYQNFLFENGLD